MKRKRERLATEEIEETEPFEKLVVFHPSDEELVELMEKKRAKTQTAEGEHALWEWLMSLHAEDQVRFKAYITQLDGFVTGENSFLRGFMRDGLNSSPAREEAIHILQEGAAKDPACFSVLAHMSDDPAESFAFIRKGAENGHGYSMWSLATEYHNGGWLIKRTSPYRLRKDLKQAARWCKKAYLHGYTRALDGNSYTSLRCLQVEDPSCVIPYGYWTPTQFEHQWVPDYIHWEMKSWLLVNQRRRWVPRGVRLLICAFICTASLPNS